MPTKKRPSVDMQARYRVLIAGIARPGKAPLFQGEIATGEEIGDEARVAKLLELKRIEVTDDESDGDGL